MSDHSEGSDGDKSLDKIDDICRDFLRNVCKRGKRCKFRHPEASEARELGRRHEYTFCHDFQNSGCRRANCKFIHCTREEEDYYKQTGQLPVRLQQAAALGIGVVANELPLLKGEVPICKDFLKGECKRGQRCKYRHMSNNESHYDFELRQPERPLTRTNNTLARYETFNNDFDKYDKYNDYDHSPPLLKRRKIDLEEVENNYFLDGYRALRPTSDYRLLEDENIMLRRKVEELKKQVNDLAATNEVLLEQNARFRANKASVTTTPIVTVSQVVTPTITAAPAVARTALPAVPLNQLNTSLPQLTLDANTELILSQGALAPQLATELAQAAAASNAPTSINPPVSVSPQTIIPVSISMETIAAASARTQGTLQTAVTLAQATNLQQTCAVSLPQSSLPQNIMSGPNTAMVSYPIMSHTQLPTSSLG